MSLLCVCVWHPLFVDKDEPFRFSFLCGRNAAYMYSAQVACAGSRNLIFDHSQKRMLLFLVVVSPVLFIKGKNIAIV